MIVNADDFGLDELTTLAIDEAMRAGICTGTTLMVNMPYAAEAVSLARKNGYFDRVGLHLNLTAGRPLTDNIRRSPSFCDEQGLFNGRFRKRRIVIAGEDRALLCEEARAQLAAFRAFRPSVFHMDSHHHIHAEWAFTGAVADLLRDGGVQSIRISRNLRRNASFPYKIYKAMCNAKIRAMGARTANFFTDADDIGLLAGKKNGPGLVEVMLHPRRETAGGPLLDGNAPFQDSAARIERIGIEKTSYAQIILGAH